LWKENDLSYKLATPARNPHNKKVLNIFVNNAIHSLENPQKKRTYT